MELKEKYINLFTDFGFKKIFGTESNKDLLIDFLNTVLNEETDKIVDIFYGKQEFLSRRAKDRKAIFDIYCQTDKGDKIIIELQRAEQSFFKDRSIYYATFPIQEQGKRGDWDYELLPVYTIAIMDFEFIDSPTDKVVSYVMLREKDNPKPFYDKLAFIYIEMPKFLKQTNELHSGLDKWIYAFKNMHQFETMPQEVKEGIFLKLFEECKIANYSPKEIMKYKESWKIYNDNKNVMDFAIAKAEAKAEERGLVRGLEKGLEKGLERGLEKGREEERALSDQKQRTQAVAFAVSMIQNSSLTDTQISETTGLPAEEIAQIRKEMQS